MTYDQENIFAKIINGDIRCEKIFEDRYTIAFHDKAPQVPVHILIIPKGQYVSMDDFSKNGSDAEISGLMRTVGKIARDFDLISSGYRILANHGPHAHQVVHHFHIHLLGGCDLGGIIRIRQQ